MVFTETHKMVPTIVAALQKLTPVLHAQTCRGPVFERCAMNTLNESGTHDRRMAVCLRRAGMAGFLFFLIKGLFWLAAPFLFVWLGFAF
jgi:hypothetical protein